MHWARVTKLSYFRWAPICWNFFENQTTSRNKSWLGAPSVILIFAEADFLHSLLRTENSLRKYVVVSNLKSYLVLQNIVHRDWTSFNLWEHSSVNSQKNSDNGYFIFTVNLNLWLNKTRVFAAIFKAWARHILGTSGQLRPRNLGHVTNIAFFASWWMLWTLSFISSAYH